MIRFVRSVLALSLALLFVSHAFAGQRPQTHDGFFLRLSAGAGAAATEIEDPDEKLTLSGSAGDVNIAIGGMVSESLALHATLFGWSISDPDAELTGFPKVELPGTLTLGGLGIGVTNYFMPSNFYVSASIGLASLELDIDGLPELGSGSGLGMELCLGKEWWAGDNWGLGVAAGFQYHNIPDKEDDSASENWKGVGFGVRFSATYN